MYILCLLPQLSSAFRPRAGAGLGQDPVMKAGPWGFHSFTLVSVLQKHCLDKLTWACQLNLAYFKYMLISANLPQLQNLNPHKLLWLVLGVCFQRLEQKSQKMALQTLGTPALESHSDCVTRQSSNEEDQC